MSETETAEVEDVVPVADEATETEAAAEVEDAKPESDEA